jgi:acetylglutamate kinase
MQNAIAKAQSLIEAHQYIRRFQGKVVVVKVGGSIMDEPAALNRLLLDVCFMDTVGIRPVVVHGGGKSITAAMQQAGLEAQFVQGRRYTDERTLSIAEHVLIKEVNDAMVNEIQRQGQRAMGLHSLSSCVVFASRLFLTAEGAAPNGGQRKVDLGLVGQVQEVNAALLRALVEGRYIPVIAPIARDAAGGKLNVNADSVAGYVAAAMKAEKLVLVSDTHGIRTSASDAGSLATHLTRQQIRELIESGVISAGMLPKVEAALVALEAGVNKVHIIDGRLDHSLLLEIYTDHGIGTEIVLD